MSIVHVTFKDCILLGVKRHVINDENITWVLGMRFRRGVREREVHNH